MGRLIDTSNIKVKPQYMQDVMGIAMIRCEDLSRILADVPTVEAIPKTEYEARLKADMMAMLEDLDLLIYKFDSSGCGFAGNIKKIDAHGLVQQKIIELERKINEKTKSPDGP